MRPDRIDHNNNQVHLKRGGCTNTIFHTVLYILLTTVLRLTVYNLQYRYDSYCRYCTTIQYHGNVKSSCKYRVSNNSRNSTHGSL